MSSSKTPVSNFSSSTSSNSNRINQIEYDLSSTRSSAKIGNSVTASPKKRNCATIPPKKQNRQHESTMEELEEVKSKKIVMAEIMKQEDQAMIASIAHVESILSYKFKNPKLCEEALTHSSNTDHISYQTLEFVGDSALGLAITNYLFLTHRVVGPGVLSALRAANISTEKLARIAVKHNLYSFVRKNSPKLDGMVNGFIQAVEKEKEMGLYMISYGGSFVKAPKVLADIVEALVAAVYVDCNFNLEYCWTVIRELLDPIITSKNIDEHQPVTTLYEYFQKKGKNISFQVWKKENNTVVTNVFVDGEVVGIGSSEHQNIAKLNAARDALQKIPDLGKDDEEEFLLNGEEGIFNAKHRLNEMCSRRRWPKPVYTKTSEQGPAHDREFVSSVLVTTPSTEFYKVSAPMRKLKDAENSAAAKMLYVMSRL